MKYVVITTARYRKSVKRLRFYKQKHQALIEVVRLLQEGRIIPLKYQDHKLQGNMSHFRELHIQPDLLLVYQRMRKLKVVRLVNVGSHSDIF